MSDLKQVKVDNWGIYFLQRLKHFFNRTDYCDLTLQFQDNAQLKVHRLVLSACTEYFELLERTCEMYEDCLVMPDDLQADVVVPIVNFMYTGQLEFRNDLLEKLYQTSQIMNMPVLTKLLDAQRSQNQHSLKTGPIHNSYSKSHSSSSKHYSKLNTSKQSKPATPMPSTSNTSNKRSYTKAFKDEIIREKKVYTPTNKADPIATKSNEVTYRASSSFSTDPIPTKKYILGEPRPTRYELPEELDTDNVFDNSFTNVSYTSQPLMVHPETTKHYSSKRSGIFSNTSGSKKFIQGSSAVDLVECKKIMKNDNIFEDDLSESIHDESEFFDPSILNLKNDSPKDANQLFDQILDNNYGPKVTIETKDNTQTNNLDHAKIISEVLKKYPHLVKSNKNIKLKILNTPTKTKKQQPSPSYNEEKGAKPKAKTPDFTYETDVMDSKEAAKLIALGAENVKGPWICLICGTPGRALHFTSYYKFRRHLVEVHNEKPVANICEHCGLKSLKRNYLLHHLYTKHGVEPPPQYHFPKCNLCNYIGLTEALLVKHKITHVELRNFRCNVCAASFNSSSLLLQHIQATGHKYSADRKPNLQCVYCLRVFYREGNLYAHLKTHHKGAAKSDGIIDDSDEEENVRTRNRAIKTENIKFEPPTRYENDFEDVDPQYQIQQRPDGNIQVISKKPRMSVPKQKILNPGFNTTLTKPTHTTKQPVRKIPNKHNEIFETISSDTDQNEEIILIGNTEYIMRDNQLIPRKAKSTTNEEFIISDVMEAEDEQELHTIAPTTSMEFAGIHKTGESIQQPKMAIKKSANINQPIQIVVSNEEEYKALISSDHSIIFDDSDTNKALTVLTAPHTTTLDATTIDLDNTQPSDMMIIPDYPLNVSEAVSADNPNIVVVYSHNAGDQNKQYQLITSQHIGTQFVQSSAVITQNYETITTSTPVINAQVINTQTEESWQENIHHNVNNQQVQISSETELLTMRVAEQTEMTPAETDTNRDLSELPEVELIPQGQQVLPMQENQVNPTLNESNLVNSENVDHNIEVIQNNSITPMDVDVVCETVNNVMEKHIDEDIQSKDKTESEVIPQVNDNDESLSVVQNETIETITQENSEKIEESLEEINKTETNLKNSDLEITQNITASIEKEEETSQKSDMAEILPVCNEHVPFTEVSKEQIQNLTSEWSEDEETVEQEQNDEDENDSKCVEESKSTLEDTSEIEESIENIQQEVQKLRTDTVEEIEAKQVTNAQEEILQDLQETDYKQTDHEPSATPTNNVETPQENISSLLNDWEENDSQEENASINGNESDAPTPPDAVENNDPVKTVVKSDRETSETETPNLNKKPDNINNLVSDWDEEEEENKD